MKQPLNDRLMAFFENTLALAEKQHQLVDELQAIAAITPSMENFLALSHACAALASLSQSMVMFETEENNG